MVSQLLKFYIDFLAIIVGATNLAIAVQRPEQSYRRFETPVWSIFSASTGHLDIRSVQVKSAPQGGGRRMNLPIFKDQGVRTVALEEERAVQIEKPRKLTEEDGGSHGQRCRDHAANHDLHTNFFSRPG